MRNLMLTLDDAVKVAKRYSDMDEEILRDEFEQKCWIHEYTDEPRERLVELIAGITPAEIASQIKSDSLRIWCKYIQVEMQLTAMQIRGQQNDG